MTRKRVLFRVIVTLCALLLLALLVNLAYTAVRRAIYPEKYTAIVTKYAGETGLPTSLVYAVIQCESGFNPDAVSSVGAQGLMQLTPDTFNWIKSKSGAGTDDADSEFNPDINVKYGTWLLALNLKDFGSEEVALAAYHAGRGRVGEWLRDPQFSDDGKTLKEIPFADTRAYVAKVQKTQKEYEALYK